MPARWFRIAYAENAFRRLLSEHNTELASLRLPAALRLAGEFYRDHRAQHTTPDNGDDVLTVGWGAGADGMHYSVHITRRMLRNDGTQAPVELQLTLDYRMTPARAELDSGHLSCSTPNEISEFLAGVRDEGAYVTLSSASPLAVALDTGRLDS